MDTRWIKLCFLLILCAEYFGLADSATLQGSLDPNPAVKDNQHTIKCDFQLAAGDSFEGLKLYLGTSATPENLVAQIRAGGSHAWSSNNIANDFKQRGYLQGTKDDGHLYMVINSTECGDKDRNYLCLLEYFIGATKQQDLTETISTLSQLQAAPLAPSEMTGNPVSVNVMEHTNMTFECRGKVGRPAGSFKWYKFIGSGSGTGQEITNQAEQENEVLSGDGCTYTRMSQLTLNLTRTEANEKLVVRCRVDQVLVDPGLTGCSDPDTDFCRMSPEINVQYPVKVTVTSDTVTAQEGGDLALDCMTHGNPAPTSPQWQKEGENTTTSGNLLISPVSMDDAGTYVCTAFNTIDGVQLNDSIAVNVLVDETTTAPPTTTTVTTSTELTSKSGQTDKAGSDDNTTIIIIVVVVVVVLVVIAIIAVFCVLRRRRKGKAVEEPPEKPFNNNAGINTVAARPDLVSSYDNGPPGYKNEDGLAYAELQFDNKPRSRRPLAIDDSLTDYSDVSMPQV